MSDYALEGLIELWKREQLTVGQMIGQILQLLKEHEQRLRGGGDPGKPLPPSRPKR